MQTTWQKIIFAPAENQTQIVQPLASYFNDFTWLLRLINMHRSRTAEHSECSEWQHLFVYTSFTRESVAETVQVKGKGKGHPCTGTEALYRPYGP